MWKVTIAGGGAIGHTYSEALAGLDQVQINGIWDPNPEMLRKDSTASGGIPVRATYEELINAEEAEIVCICLPLPIRQKYALRAAKNRKHIICEAPLAESLEQAQELKEACRTYGVRLFVTHHA